MCCVFVFKDHIVYKKCTANLKKIYADYMSFLGLNILFTTGNGVIYQGQNPRI
jgi:hypothetical protein